VQEQVQPTSQPTAMQRVGQPLRPWPQDREHDGSEEPEPEGVCPSLASELSTVPEYEGQEPWPKEQRACTPLPPVPPPQGRPRALSRSDSSEAMAWTPNGGPDTPRAPPQLAPTPAAHGGPETPRMPPQLAPPTGSSFVTLPIVLVDGEDPER